jgi:oligopeptide transport system substrate-binding protein
MQHTLLTLLLLVLFTGCTKEVKTTKKTIDVALTTNISTLDPAVSYDTVSAEVVYQVYEPLFEYDYLIRPYKIKPLIAQAMPIIENNGLKYTIKIKPNIYYHDSPAFNDKKRSVKAVDFINQIRRLAFRKTKSNGWWLFADKIKGLDDFRNKAKDDFSDFYTFPIEGLSAPDDQTLIINLKRPYPQLIFALAMAFTSPMPKELIDYHKNDLSQHAVGTGPFYLKRWDTGLGVKLIKFADYHDSRYPEKGDRFSYENQLLKDKGKKIPFIDGIQFHIMKEAHPRWLNFQKKKVDFIILTKDHFSIALDPNGKLRPEFEKNGVQLQISPTLTYWWLAFNMKDPILGKNLNLRRAVSHAIDIEKYIKIFTNNIALQANSIYPPGIPGYNPSSKLPYSYDLEKAKEYMKKAGYPDGKGLPTLKYDVRGSSTVARQMGEFIKGELGKIGIKIDIVINSFPGFLNKARTGQLQFWQGGWAMDYPDAENTAQLLITKNHPPAPNTTYFSNKEVDKLYKVIAETKDMEKKKKAMLDVEELIHKNLPWIMQFYSRNYILYHKHIKNFRQSDLIYNNYKYLRIE